MGNTEETAAAFHEITTSSTKVNDLVIKISPASKDQTYREEINKSLVQVNSVVQKNQSISGKTATASNELSNQTAQLHQMMKKFKLKKTIEPSSANAEKDKKIPPGKNNQKQFFIHRKKDIYPSNIS